MSHQQRSFPCTSCQQPIYVPIDLPPTQAPCPHCGQIVTSPAPNSGPPPAAPSAVPLPARPPAQQVPAPQPQPSGVNVPPPSRAAAAATTASAAAQKTIEMSPAQKRATNANSKVGLIVGSLCLLLLLAAGAAAFMYFSKDGEKITVPKGTQTAGAAGAVGDAAESGSSQSTPSLLTKTLSERIDFLVGEEPEILPSHLSQDYQREGWKKDALAVLDQFINAKTLEQRMAVCLQTPTLERDMRVFYQEYPFDHTDSPVAAFSFMPLEQIDTSRGLFSMSYHRPIQFELGEFFRPIPPLKVQMGLEEPGTLLTFFAQRDNFLMDPLKVQPFFLKPEGEEMRIDWYTFVQARFNLIEKFSTEKKLGSKGVFRVYMVQDVTIDSASEGSDVMTYRLFEPADLEISMRAVVPLGTEVAKALEPLNWIGMPEKRRSGRTATVEVSVVDGEFVISDFICYEFLGLGGKM